MHATYQPINQRVSFGLIDCTMHPVDQQVNHVVSQSVSQPVNQLANQLTKQPYIK